MMMLGAARGAAGGGGSGEGSRHGAEGQTMVRMMMVLMKKSGAGGLCVCFFDG